MNNLLVIIVTYNAMKWIEKCIESVIQSTVTADVLVVDNGSKDKTIEFIKCKFPSVIIVESKENLGFGKANNLGLDYALKNDYDYVYLLNQDAWVMPDTFKIMIDAQKKQPEYGVLSPIQLTASMDRFDKNFARICKLDERKCDLLENLFFNNSRITNITCVMAAHWLISKECLIKVGGFSPAFPHYDEDDNYAERVFYKGLRVGIVQHAMAVHDREYRQYSKEFLIYKSYVDSIRLLSSLKESTNNPWLICVKTAIWGSFYYKSIKPISYFFKLLKQKQTIKNYKIESYNDSAFLLRDK